MCPDLTLVIKTIGKAEGFDNSYSCEGRKGTVEHFIRKYFVSQSCVCYDDHGGGRYQWQIHLVRSEQVETILINLK